MNRLARSAALAIVAVSLATAADAGSLAPAVVAEEVLAPEIVIADAAGSSAGGIILPLLFIALLAATFTGGSTLGPA